MKINSKSFLLLSQPQPVAIPELESKQEETGYKSSEKDLIETPSEHIVDQINDVPASPINAQSVLQVTIHRQIKKKISIDSKEC